MKRTPPLPLKQPFMSTDMANKKTEEFGDITDEVEVKTDAKGGVKLVYKASKKPLSAKALKTIALIVNQHIDYCDSGNR